MMEKEHDIKFSFFKKEKKKNKVLDKAYIALILLFLVAAQHDSVQKFKIYSQTFQAKEVPLLIDLSSEDTLLNTNVLNKTTLNTTDIKTSNQIVENRKIDNRNINNKNIDNTIVDNKNIKNKDIIPSHKPDTNGINTTDNIGSIEEKLTGFLFQQTPSYESVSQALRMVQDVKSERIAPYLKKYTWEKIKRDNDFLYKNNTKELRLHYSQVKYLGFTRFFVSDKEISDNSKKFKLLYDTYQLNHDIIASHALNAQSASTPDKSTHNIHNNILKNTNKS